MEYITLTKSKQDLPLTLTTSIGLCIQGTVGNVMNIGKTDHEAICKKSRLQYDNHPWCGVQGIHKNLIGLDS
jgi:hypothetical protein